jgi:NTP pyrophosphatase (non-canonical NTP hydrolase)
MKTVEEWQNDVDQWINTYGQPWPKWNYFARLVEEVGEVGKVLSIQEGHREKRYELEKLETEMGDVLFVLLALANHLKIDMNDAIKQAMDKYTERVKK